MSIKTVSKSMGYGKRMMIGLCMALFLFVETTTSYAAEGDSLKKEGESLSLNYTGKEETVNIERSGLYTVQLYGAQGGTNVYEGGKGGYLEATVSLEKGDLLIFTVGGQNGFNGGGTGTNANGGGATDVRFNGKELSDRILVAGGGGGASGGNNGDAGGTASPGTTVLGMGASDSSVNSGGGGGGHYGGQASYNHVHSGSANQSGACFLNYTKTYYSDNCTRVDIRSYYHYPNYDGDGNVAGTAYYTRSSYTETYDYLTGQTTRSGTTTQNGSWDFHEGDPGTHNSSYWLSGFMSKNNKSWTTTAYHNTCGLDEGTYPSSGGSNYAMPEVTTINNSLSGQRTGNGYALLTLTDVYFNIDEAPIDTAVFESMDAVFNCYSAVSSDGGKYVWQIFYNHEYRDIATLTYDGPAVKSVALYGTDYEIGFDQNMASYLKIKNTSRDKNNDTIYRCIVYDDVKGTNNLISNDVKLTVLTNAVTDMGTVYMHDVLEVNSEIKTQDIFAICSYQAGGTDVLRNFAGLSIISIDDNNGNKHIFDTPAASVKAYKTGNLTVNMKFENEISYMKDGETVAEIRTYYPSFNIRVVDTTKPVISNVDSSLDAYGNYYAPGNDPFLQIRSNVMALDNFCETEVFEPNSIGKSNPVKVDTGQLTYSFYRMDFETGYWQMISDGFRVGNFYDVIFSYGNGKYRVYAKDLSGNVSEPYDFTATGWDNVPPGISVSLVSSSGYSRYADIFSDVSDGVLGRYNIGQLSAAGAYYLEKVENDTSLKARPSEIADWTFENTFHLLENGLYRVYARDNFENMSSNTIHINNIDTVSPTVSYKISSCGDGKKVLVTLKATDSNAANTNSAVSGLRNGTGQGTFDCFECSSNVSLSPYTVDGEYLRTYFYAEAGATEDYKFSTYDNAGNYTSNAVSADDILDVIRKGDDEDYNIVTGFTCTNTDYTTIFPEYTANGVIITAEVETGTMLPAGAYSWDYDGYFGTNEGYWDKKNGTWSSNPAITVKENGIYTVFVRLADGFIYRKSVEVTNIDNQEPAITASLDGGTLSVTATDAESGLSKLIVDGGSLANTHEFSYDGKNSVKEMIALPANGTYSIYAVDMAGNRSENYSKVVSSIPTESKNFYTVNFKTYTGAILYSQYVREGEDAVPPASAKKDGFTFVGWDKSYVNIQENLDINAVFVENVSPETKSYTVTFWSWNGAILKAQAVAEGKDATPPSNPTRNGYIFSGWDKPYANIKEDTNIKALYIENITAVKNTYTVKFLNWDGAVLKAQAVEEGKDAIPPSNPAQSGHTFAGWDKSYANIKADVEIKALYHENPSTEKKSYTVTFYSWNGAVLNAQAVEEGKDAKPPSNPARNGYLFSGWDKPYANIKADTDINALYIEDVKDVAGVHTVLFYNWDGAVLKAQAVEEGKDAIPPGNPARSGHTFAGWDKSYANIKADVEIKALYHENPSTEKKSYTVTFYSWNGAVLNSQAVEEGKDAKPPSDPMRSGYIFSGWDKPYANIKTDTDITALYIETIEKPSAAALMYVVTFCNWDGAVLDAQAVTAGQDAVPPSDPARDGYVFSGWDGSYANINQNTEITAIFKEDKNKVADPIIPVKYIVTFCNWDGAILDAQTVEEGKDAVPPKSPERDGHTFSGWDKGYANIREDVATTALFTVSEPEEEIESGTPVKTGSSGNGLSSILEEEPAEAIEEGSHYIELSEFADEAKILPVSAYDRNPVVEEAELADEEYIDTILDPERAEENAGRTTEDTTVEEPENSTAKKAGAVGVLALSGGGSGFYFLNRKYYWLNLPF